MDPYLEGNEWEDFHSRFNVAVSDALAAEILPKYVVRVQQRVYVEHEPDGDDQVRQPDVSVMWTGGKRSEPGEMAGTSTSALAPIECVLPMPEERKETYLVIREVPSLEVVTVIETLSPANKRSSSDGRKQYLKKRDEILESKVNLIELDLLRGGKRLPVRGRLPAGDFFAIVSRGIRRPRTDVYAWTLRQQLPEIPVPLRPGESEPRIKLQQILDAVYDRAGYQVTLDYTSKLNPALNEADVEWMRALLGQK
jgi:hypothetical protein